MRDHARHHLVDDVERTLAGAFERAADSIGFARRDHSIDVDGTCAECLTST